MQVVPITLNNHFCFQVPEVMISNLLSRRSFPRKTMKDLLRLDQLGKRFVQMCADLFPFRKHGGLLYLVCEKIHSVLHAAAEIMRWGNPINSSGEAAEGPPNQCEGAWCKFKPLRHGWRHSPGPRQAKGVRSYAGFCNSR